MPVIPRSAHHGTSAQIMNMDKSRSVTASTISTIFNPIKKTFGLKKRLSKRGTNALFRAISAENWELVSSIADTKPYKAEAWHNALGFFDAHRSSKILPLHQACIFHPTPDALMHIIQAFPNALRAKESGYGRVPLHIACHSNASLECIQVLISNFPAASVEQDIIGRVPLHYALSNGASYEIVMALMDAAKQVAGPNGVRHVCSVADFNGWMPIHVACFMGVSPQVLALLVSAYPDAVDVATKKNSTPRGLLKGISMADDKKAVLDLILINKGTTPFAARVSPVRTNIDKVVGMSDETCSKGVTLEIEEDETSSLSSMETSLTKKSLSKGGRLTHQEYNNFVNLPQPTPLTRSPSSRTSSQGRKPTSPQLPIHSVYEEEETKLVHPVTFKEKKTDVFFPPSRSREESIVRKVSQDSIDGKSKVSDDEQSVDPIFQPIASTAAFC